MKLKISDILKVITLFFFMVMGIFFILAGLLYMMGMPLTDGWLTLVLIIANLCEIAWCMWVKN